MTERTVTHATFALDRTYDASPARVFAAWAKPEAKARWFVGPDNWRKSDHQLDFRVGGSEHVSGGPPGGPIHHYDAIYQDIVPNERIIYGYDMHLDDTRISVSLATVEFRAAGEGTRLIFTEQGAFLDGFDDPKLRERGSIDLLENLGKELARQS
jgi:uncharacterized protein YndB with AHSA1/START domain